MDDRTENVLRLLAGLLLVLLNGFFVAAEFALVRIRETQLRPLAQQGNRRARLARQVMRNLNPYLGACQLGITMASLALSLVSEPAISHLLEPLMVWVGISSEKARQAIAFAIGYSFITALHIVIGEQAPKFLALKVPLPTTLWVVYPLDWFYRVSRPFIILLNKASNLVLRWIGVEGDSEHGGAHSEDELRLMFAETIGKQGGTEQDGTEHDGSLGRQIVLNAFDLRLRLVRDVMRPRNEIISLDSRASIEECLELAERMRYSRYPLCEEGNPDRTLGVVHFKDLVSQRNKARTAADLAGVSRRLIFIPETARLERLLGMFLERKLHLALVVDEFGGTVGMVTLENCLEELVGEIQDEHDQEKPRWVKRGESEWELDGTLPVHELADRTGQVVVEEGVTSLGGWVVKRLGGFARVGDRVPVGRHELCVLEVDGMRVARLSLRRVSVETGSDTARITRT